MSDEQSGDSVRRLLRLLGGRLEDYLDGDERALDDLAEQLEEEGASGEDVRSASLVLRALGRETGGPLEPSIEGAPGPDALRIPSAEEREALSPEAWGYLLALRRRGSLTPGQLEQVLEQLGDSGVRPVDVAMARDVATRVALQTGDTGSSELFPHGDYELPH